MSNKALHHFILSVFTEHKKKLQHGQIKCSMSSQKRKKTKTKHKAIFISLSVLDYITVFSVKRITTVGFQLQIHLNSTNSDSARDRTPLNLLIIQSY